MLDSTSKIVIIASKIVIVGIGGCGRNMLNSFAASKGIGCHTIATDSDDFDFRKSVAPVAAETFSLFDKSPACGLRGNILSGAQIGERYREEFLRRISGYDTVILCAGLGGGTGSGVTYVFTKAAMDAGMNVLCLCALPFQFEGEERRRTADLALNAIQSHKAWVEVLDNQELYKHATKEWTFADAFRFADQHFLSLLHDAAISGFDRQSFDLSRCKVS